MTITGKEFFIGVDVGTTGTKAVVFDGCGTVCAKDYQAYDCIMNQPGYQELDPDLVFNAVCLAISNVANAVPNPERICTIGVSSLGEALIPIDKKGRKLANSMLGSDVRGKEAYQHFHEKMGGAYIAEHTGHPYSPDYSVSKLLWMKENHPEIWDGAQRFLLYEDYINFRLTGETVIDYSLASRTMLFDIFAKNWSAPLLEYVGLSPNRLSRPVLSGTIIGNLLPSVCKKLGLSPGVCVVAGGHDVPTALMGGGAILGQNRAVDTIGTTECISVPLHVPLSKETILDESLVCEPSMEKDCYNTLAFMWNGGILLEWFKKTFSHDDSRDFFSEYDGRCVQDPSRLLVMPHFSGTGTMHAGKKPLGAVIGLTLKTNPSDIYQAILEGINFEMRMNLEKLRGTSAKIQEIVAVGGGTKSSVWLQMKANIYNCPIFTLECWEAGAMGVAIAGATAVGYYPDHQTAVQHMIHNHSRFDPNYQVASRYEVEYQRYKKLFDALEPLRQ